MQPDDKSNDQDKSKAEQNSAADLIRKKLDAIYGTEPDAKEEKAEVEAIPETSKLSKHQKYMKGLSDSKRSLAEIQTAWHEYYVALPDKEKHEVWQEFYAQHDKSKQKKSASQLSEAEAKPHHTQTKSVHPNPVPASHNTSQLKHRQRRSRSRTKGAVDLSAVKDVKSHLLGKVQARSEIKKNPHVKAVAFGLTMGCVTLFVLLFGFFNERFITPFIRPNANVSATPIIVDPQASGPVGPEPKIIIPKINVEAPVVYDVPTIQEKDVQKGLEKGVVHYITTPNPGEQGNSVIFGHSSSNILNKGNYKFAFLMLKSLEKDDTFIVQKDSKRYVYKIYNMYVTDPTDLSVLGSTGRPATMTLITCDPPGTSTKRLIVQAEQIFPNPSTNAPSTVSQTSSQPTQLPSNSQTLWSRITGWF